MLFGAHLSKTGFRGFGAQRRELIQGKNLALILAGCALVFFAVWVASETCHSANIGEA